MGIGHGVRDPARVLHQHDCLELNYFKSGAGVNIIGETVYNMKDGDIFLINSNELHYAFSEDCSMELLVLFFDPRLIWSDNSFDYDYLKPFLEREVYFHNLIEANTDLGKELGSILIKIEKECNEELPGYKHVIKSYLLLMLSLLYRNLKQEHKLSDDFIDQQKSYARIKEAVLYINSHYNEELNLSDISKIVYMSPTYFSSYFKKVMKKNIFDYITSLRINSAARLLKETSKSIAAICAECGFKSVPHFSFTFKKFTSFSPSKYRGNSCELHRH